MNEIIQTAIEKWGVLGVIFIAAGWVIFDMYKTIRARNTLPKELDDLNKAQGKQNNINVFTGQPTESSGTNQELKTILKSISDSVTDLKSYGPKNTGSKKLKNIKGSIRNILETHLRIANLDHSILAIIQDDSRLETIAEAIRNPGPPHFDAPKKDDINSINIKNHPLIFNQLLYCGRISYTMPLDIIQDQYLYSHILKKWDVKRLYLDIIPVNHGNNITKIAVLISYAYDDSHEYNQSDTDTIIRTIESLMSEI